MIQTSSVPGFPVASYPGMPSVAPVTSVAPSYEIANNEIEKRTIGPSLSAVVMSGQVVMEGNDSRAKSWNGALEFTYRSTGYLEENGRLEIEPDDTIIAACKDFGDGKEEVIGGVRVIKGYVLQENGKQTYTPRVVHFAEVAKNLARDIEQMELQGTSPSEFQGALLKPAYERIAEIINSAPPLSEELIREQADLERAIKILQDERRTISYQRVLSDPVHSEIVRSILTRGYVSDPEKTQAIELSRFIDMTTFNNGNAINGEPVSEADRSTLFRGTVQVIQDYLKANHLDETLLTVFTNPTVLKDVAPALNFLLRGHTIYLIPVDDSCISESAKNEMPKYFSEHRPTILILGVPNSTVEEVKKKFEKKE